MATIEQQSKPIFPLRVRVDVSNLPESFSVTPHRIQHTRDNPLPEYTTEKEQQSPEETSLDEFQEESKDESEEIYAFLQSLDNGSGFTEDEIKKELDGRFTEQKVFEAIHSFAMEGRVFQPDDGTWKTI